VQRFIDYATRLGIDTVATFAGPVPGPGHPRHDAAGRRQRLRDLANGGYRVEPYLIERIEDLAGEIVIFEPSRRRVPRLR
jgi:penicillin-binding protein 1A